jgi:UDP-2,3-diacylglucosamine pyrophosphatase LpxH
MKTTAWPGTAVSGRVVIVSDAHLGDLGGDGEELREQLSELTQDNCALLLFMGDLFHLWVGDPRFETAEIRAFLPTLEGLRSRGVPSVYVEGNRDFFLAHGPYAKLFDRVALEVSFEHGGIRYLAVHGDGINDRDWRYRFWRRLSKNRLSRLASRVVPGDVGRRLVTSTEEQLSKTNFEHKKQLPVEAIQSYGERRLSRGHDVLLMGHFHVGCRFDVPSGEVRLLDAWYNRRRLEPLEVG